MNDQHSKEVRTGGVPQVAKAAAEAIHKRNPNHLVIADDNNVGSSVILKLLIGILPRCRGYHPGIISHYKSP